MLQFYLFLEELHYLFVGFVQLSFKCARIIILIDWLIPLGFVLSLLVVTDFEEKLFYLDFFLIEFLL